MGSVAGYAVMTILSYWIGQKKYPIHLPPENTLVMYVLFSTVLYAIGRAEFPLRVCRAPFRTVLLLIFMAYVVRMKKEINLLALIGEQDAGPGS